MMMCGSGFRAAERRCLFVFSLTLLESENQKNYGEKILHIKGVVIIVIEHMIYVLIIFRLLGSFAVISAEAGRQCFIISLLMLQILYGTNSGMHLHSRI